MPGPRYRALQEIERLLRPPAPPPVEADEDSTPLEEFLRDNPDATLWTAAQARQVLARLARMMVRRYRLRQP